MPLFRRSKDKEYTAAARLLASGNAEEAIEALERIIELNPDHMNAHVTLAIALMEAQENPDRDSARTIEAFSHLDTAAILNPEDPVPVFNMGVCLRNLGMLEESLVSFEKAIAIEERLPLAILHMAEVNYELERWEEAIRLAKLALIRDPGLESSMGWVRVAMRKAGMLDDDGNVIHRPD
ncbi:MAG: tetratricopeptide repeat protein [Candidatus Thorarchaeota archaeon]|jgi:tetratricopeptide (TPR) repeat protein